MGIRTAPVATHVVRALRIDLHRESVLSNHGDPQFHAFLHIRLHGHGAMTYGLHTNEILIGDDLSECKSLVSLRAVAWQKPVMDRLRNHGAVVLTVEVQKVAGAIRDQGRRYVESEAGRHL